MSVTFMPWPRLREVLKIIWNYLFLVIWDIWYFTKTKIAIYYLPRFVLALCVVEIGGAVYHWLAPNSLPLRYEQWLTGILGIAAFLLVLHHLLLEANAKQYEAVMATLRTLFTESLDSFTPQATDAQKQAAIARCITHILVGLVDALESKHGIGMMNVSILIRHDDNDAFEIYDQWRPGSFPRDVKVPADGSAAAICSLFENGTMLYIPNTACLHGVPIQEVAATHPDVNSFYTAVSHYYNAFKPLGEYYDPKILRSLLCTKISTENLESNRTYREAGIFPGSTMILCLGSQRIGNMGSLEFRLLQMVASLITLALKGHG